LTEKSSTSSGPTPQLARAKNTRIAFLDEPEDDVQIHKGVIKRYTGGDTFFARLLQDNGGDIQATFKMILVCNKVPIIPNADSAVQNRTRLFPFLSTWDLKDIPEEEEEQYSERKFKMDPFFEFRIPILAPAFLWIMAQYYPHYIFEGLNDPQIVIEHTASYWRDNDVYAQFAADNIREIYDANGARDIRAHVTLTEIYREFKAWFHDCFPGTKVPDRRDVGKELTSRWGRMVGNGWYGINLVIHDGPEEMSNSLLMSVRPQLPSVNNSNIANASNIANIATSKDEKPFLPTSLLNDIPPIVKKLPNEPSASGGEHRRSLPIKPLSPERTPVKPQLNIIL
jgi:hypothetical protein